MKRNNSWSEDEIDFLKDHYQVLSNIEIGKTLKRNTSSVSSKAYELNLNKDRHGLSNTKLYSTWKKIKQRCFYKKDKDYDRYGGRGITVCDEWKNDPVSFYNWALENGYEEGLSIDRIDNDGNYCPENCRWATPKEQMNNTSLNVRITVFDETKTISEWFEDERCQVDIIWTLYSRINKRGWSPEKALTTKTMENKDKSVLYEAFGEQKSIRDWSEDPRCKIKADTLRWRIKHGYKIEDAIKNEVHERCSQ